MPVKSAAAPVPRKLSSGSPCAALKSNTSLHVGMLAEAPSAYCRKAQPPYLRSAGIFRSNPRIIPARKYPVNVSPRPLCRPSQDMPLWRSNTPAHGTARPRLHGKNDSRVGKRSASAVKTAFVFVCRSARQKPSLRLVDEQHVRQCKHPGMGTVYGRRIERDRHSSFSGLFHCITDTGCFHSEAAADHRGRSRFKKASTSCGRVIRFAPPYTMIQFCPAQDWITACPLTVSRTRRYVVPAPSALSSA